MKKFAFLLILSIFSCSSPTEEVSENTNPLLTNESKEQDILQRPKDTLILDKVKKTIETTHSDPNVKETKTVIKPKKAVKKPRKKPIKNPPLPLAKKEKILSIRSQKERVKDIKSKAGTPGISFSKTIHNFGEIKAGDVINYKFKFTNTGIGDLEILNSTATCGCTFPSFPFIAIKTNKTGEINVTYDSKTKWGDVNPEIKVFTNIRKEPYLLHLKGYVDDSKVKKVELQKNKIKQ